MYICENDRLMEEIWKDIKGYEGLYQVSNLGRVKSLDRWLIYKDGKKRLWKGQIIKPLLHKDGYYRVCLYKKTKQKYLFIHRLVAETFLGNPKKLPVINHKNCIRTDNTPDNLEFCTIQYNNEYSCAKPVLQYDKQGNFVSEWVSSMEIQRQLGFANTHISDCCLKKPHVKSAYGFKWYYKPMLWDTSKLISGRYSPEFLLKEKGRSHRYAPHTQSIWLVANPV